MHWPRRAVRLLRLSFHVLLGVVLAALLLRGDPVRASDRGRRVVTWWLQRSCRILNVRVAVRGTPSVGPALLASPHLSWLDVAVLGSSTQCLFLSKDEVRGWPVIGWLAARAGTLFVERGQRESAFQAIDDIADALRAGHRVVFFPEGTTTSGSLQRFKGRLFQAAKKAGAPVQPLVLRYPLDGETHPLVPFVGNDTLTPHVLRLAGTPRVDAEVWFLPPITDTGHSPNHLARLAEEAVRDAMAGTPETRETTSPGNAAKGATG